jgi:hypothetical protein
MEGDMNRQPRVQAIELTVRSTDADGVRIWIYLPVSFQRHENILAPQQTGPTRKLGGSGNDIESTFLYNFPDLIALKDFLDLLKTLFDLVVVGYDERQLEVYFRRSVLHKAIEAGLGDDLRLAKPENAQ